MSTGWCAVGVSWLLGPCWSGCCPSVPSDGTHPGTPVVGQAGHLENICMHLLHEFVDSRLINILEKSWELKGTVENYELFYLHSVFFLHTYIFEVESRLWRYQPISASLTSRSGTGKQLQEAVAECRKAGADLMWKMLRHLDLRDDLKRCFEAFGVDLRWSICSIDIGIRHNLYHFLLSVSYQSQFACLKSM